MFENGRKESTDVQPSGLCSDGVMGQHGGLRLSELMEQLTELNLRGEPISKLNDAAGQCGNSEEKPPPSISKILLPALKFKCDFNITSTTSCSPLAPTLFHRQPQRHQPAQKYSKVLQSWTRLSKRKHFCLPQRNLGQGDRNDVVHSEILLRITPAAVTRRQSLRDSREESVNVVSSSCSSASSRLEGPTAETDNSSSAGQSSSSSLLLDLHDDSDSSDQERTKVTAQGRGAPAGFDLRPDSFDDDDDLNDRLESEKDQSHYPEVLPVRLKILDLTQNLFSREDWERRQDLIRQDPTLFVIAGRLAEMERMQVATIQRERTKGGWSQSASAIGSTRNTTKVKKMDFLECQPEVLIPEMDLGGGGPSVPSRLTDFTLSYSTVAKRRLKTASNPSRQSRDTRGSNFRPSRPTMAHFSLTGLRETYLLGQSAQDLLLNTAPCYKGDKVKGPKKAISLKRKSSSPRKTIVRSDRKQ